jgi:hypothetical protein
MSTAGPIGRKPTAHRVEMAEKEIMGVTMGALERLRRHLYQTHVSYRVHEDKEAYTTQEIAAIEHVAGRRMLKVVMAVAGGQLVMLVLAAPERPHRHVQAQPVGQPCRHPRRLRPTALGPRGGTLRYGKPVGTGGLV